MSFAGHVFDMIRRNKEYRDMHNLRRERSKNLRSEYMGFKDASQNPNISIEELEQIDLKLKERDSKELNYVFRMKIVIYGAVIITIILIGSIHAFLCN